jgi:hypothetical protein
MLRPMSLVEQWLEIEAGLPEDWADARLALTVDDESERTRALALLGPLVPARHDRQIRFFVARRGAGPGPDSVRRLLRLLDRERIDGMLELLSSARLAPTPEPSPRRGLADMWDQSVTGLPEDWSDLYCEVELTSSDHLERAALLLAPVNPARFGGTPGFRFRAARAFGYGASAQMTRRCLARLDEARIPGELRLLRVLSDTKPVGTQGPVWYVGGKVV